MIGMAATSACRLAAPSPQPPPAAAAARPLPCRRPVPLKCGLEVSRNVIVKAMNGASDEGSTELPELVKAAQDAWDKVDDKYAVSAVAFAALIALWTATGMIAAIDRLPLVPGVLELVGIGYTAWFTYRNLIFKPDREALVDKIKTTYSDIIGSS